MQVTDLDKASKTKSDAELNKMWVSSASFILQATVGTGKKKVDQTPLWDFKQLAPDQYFSNISYLKVNNIDGNKITVTNHRGSVWHVSKDILVRDMWSADHFEQTVKCNMTDLVTILESVGDTVFKIAFKKKLDEKKLAEDLSGMDLNDMKNATLLNKLAKELTDGKEVEMVSHLCESESFMGRSLVIDLNAPEGKGYRQVDHRTIQWIVYKNVKYILGKKNTGIEELPLKPDYTKAKWDEKNLAVGNWLSQIQYYKMLNDLNKDNVEIAPTTDLKSKLTMSKDILLNEMHSASIF